MPEVSIENNNIYEDKYDQQNDFDKVRRTLMDKDQIKRADFYVKKFDELKSEKNTLETEWIEIEEGFASDRSTDSTGREIPFVNVITPNIEGQLATMTERNIKASIRGKGVSDEALANTLEPAADAIFRENKIRRKLKKIGRRYLLFGNTYVIPSWDKDMLTEGMPKINTPMMTNVLIDGMIKDYDDIDEADYIIEEIGSKSIIWARRKFGDELANVLELGEQLSMGKDQKMDDTDSFTLLNVWTKNNEKGNLQLIKMSTTGLLLEETDMNTPYYTHVNNKYPIFAIELYPKINEIHGFGDGKLLLPLQQLVNRLYDEIILAVKFSSQGRTYVDPKARLNPDEFAEADPKKPIFVNNPSQNIRTERGVGLNQVVFNLLEQIFRKVEEVTRFSALMTGNAQSTGMTATQSNIMMQQGNTGVTDKQTDIGRMLSDVLEYCLGLSLQFWTADKAFRITNTDDDKTRNYAWIEPERFKKVPVKVPATREYIENYRLKNKNSKPPEMMVLTDEAGKDMTKNIELDISVSVGEGMPNNKTAMYQMVLQLAQLQIIDEATGQPRTLFSYDQVKDMMEDILGIKIKEGEKAAVSKAPGGINMNAPNMNVEGQNAAGNPKGV
jgi:hypothetical protein